MNWRVTVRRVRRHPKMLNLPITETLHLAEFDTYEEAAKDQRWALAYYPHHKVTCEPLTDTALEQVQRLNKVLAPRLN